MNNASWQAIFEKYDIQSHDFDREPFSITAKQIKGATAHFDNTSEKEVRILCKQDTRDDRPDIFVKNGLFLLPVRNGAYVIVKGEGYVDIPEIASAALIYKSKLDFALDTSIVGDSEMQHLDFAYAASLVRTFLQDESLVLTIRGRKYTPEISFKVGNQRIETKGVQTEVDAGYEGRSQVVLVEAKNSKTRNTIIRQLFYPYRQWSNRTSKQVRTLFFERRGKYYSFWQFEFDDADDYNSIQLTRSCRYEIVED